MLARDTVPETSHGSVWPRQITLRSSTSAPTISAGTPDRAFAFLLLQRDPDQGYEERIVEEMSRVFELGRIEHGVSPSAFYDTQPELS